MKASRFLGLMVLLLGLGVAHAQVVYVDAEAGGANDGTRWTDAFTDLRGVSAVEGGRASSSSLGD